MAIIAKESIDQLSYEYMLEVQFNSLLNRVLIPREVERTIVEAIEEEAI